MYGKSDPSETRHEHAVFHTRTEALHYIESAAEFWSALPIDTSHPDVEKLAALVKFPNPHRQLSATELNLLLSVSRIQEKKTAAHKP